MLVETEAFEHLEGVLAMSSRQERQKPKGQEVRPFPMEHIIIRRYWLTSDGEGKGYGIPRPLLIVGAVLLLLFLIMGVIGVVAQLPVVIAVCFFSAELVVLVIIRTHYAPHIGTYRLDAQGKPTQFLHTGLRIDGPEMSRTRYLQHAQQPEGRM
jgi:hypothetical protein